MGLLSIDELKKLAEQPTGLCVSIYMPTYRLGQETQQNPIRFKNLIRQAEELLGEHGLKESEAGKFLQPAKDLDREEFWENQNNGLAIFVAEGVFNYYRLPLNFNELTVVTDRFHLKPLLPLLTNDGLFYILSLSQDQIKLFECTRFEAKEIELEDVPKNIDEALMYDETAKAGQFRINTSRGGTDNSFQRSGSYHGQGSPDRDNIQVDLLQFFHIVDRGIHKYLQGKNAPLVLTGVEYLFPIYREANGYPHLVAEGITGNTKLMTPEELQTEAWKIVEPIFSKAQQEALTYYKESAAAQRASSDIKEAVPAAFYGRVEQLFVALGLHQWGNFDPQNNTIQLHSEPETGDEDLLDSAAVQTILNGGIVYAVAPEKVPDKAPLAAVFRF
ncbi:hypothetical protein ACE1B6_26715 [Aerosakkonemataceae cyanobacterium BLCC-F154]|uniref:Uncharacterized protein n=1 Tax=Floridaenema fluviatile BLCC-F154 TaxID=3153640 RepID=A0ABV4YJ49_9CYAN